jgi:hypothetical protein
VRQPPSNSSTVDVERARGSRFPRPGAGAFDQAEDLSGGGAPGYRETWARWGARGRSIGTRAHRGWRDE